MATDMTAQQRIAEWYQAWREGDWDGDQTPDEFLGEYTNHLADHVDRDSAPDDMDHRLSGEEAVRFVEWLELHGAIDGAKGGAE